MISTINNQAIINQSQPSFFKNESSPVYSTTSKQITPIVTELLLKKQEQESTSLDRLKNSKQAKETLLFLNKLLNLKEENHVQGFSCCLVVNIMSGSYNSFKQNLSYLSYLTPQSQLSFLTGAHDLTKIIIEIINIELENPSKKSPEILELLNSCLCMSTLIEEKLQECRRNNPKLFPTSEIDFTKENVLEEILKKDCFMEKTIKDGLRNIFGEMPQQQQEIVLSKLDELKIFSFILLVFGMSALCLYDFYQRIPFIRNDFYNKIYFIGNLLSLDKTTWAVMGVTIVFATLVYKVEGVCSKIMVKVRNQLSYSR